MLFLFDILSCEYIDVYDVSLYVLDSVDLNVPRHIQGSFGAFAALLSDGRVVAWGDAESGGDPSEVQQDLKEVRQLQSTSFAFAALRCWSRKGFKSFNRHVERRAGRWSHLSHPF